MKKTNPVLAGLAAVALSATLMPALALATEGATTTITNQTTGSTKVNYKVDQTYTWTVPTEITFDKGLNDNVKTGTVEVTESVIEHGHKLTISLNHDNTFTLKSTNGATRSYTVSAGGKVLSADEDVLVVPAGTHDDSKELTFRLDNQAGKMEAGTYSDTLSYVASIGAQGND